MAPFITSYLVWFLMTLFERCLVEGECLSPPLLVDVMFDSLLPAVLCGLTVWVLTEVVTWLS